MKCRKCGSGNMGVMPNKKNPSATDLYCLDCGAWQKFATKDEIRLYQCKKGPITNADRIRAMNDDELATMLFDYKECNKNCIMSSGKHCYEICEEESVILKWLQQPAEED